MRVLAEHAGPVITEVLPPEMRDRYEAEGAALVYVDREEIEKLGVRLREAELLSEDTTTVRHDPEKLAKEVCEAALAPL